MRDCLSRFGGTMYGTQPRGFPFDNFIISCREVVYNAKFKNEIEKKQMMGSFIKSFYMNHKPN